LSGSFIRVTFESFDVEENTWGGGCWDELHVFDGTHVNAPLLGVFCGNTIPGPFSATNADGALTFKFVSDMSVTMAGWKALVECVPLNSTFDLQNTHFFSIFPNPSAGTFTVNFAATDAQDINIIVYNAQGRLVHNEFMKAPSINHHLSLEHLPSGLYVVKLNYNFGSKTQKIVINK